MRKLKPKTKLTSTVPEIANPKITFELLAPNQLDVSVELPLDGDLLPFAQMITWLNEGKLLPYIRQSLQKSSSPRASAILTGLDVNDKIDKEEPLVDPAKAIAYHIRKNSR